MNKDFKKITDRVKVNHERIQDMQVTSNSMQSLPLPKNEKKRLMQAEVNLELFNAVHKEMERKELKIRTVMEWGLRAFLLASNPKEASRLGIAADATHGKDRE